MRWTFIYSFAIATILVYRKHPSRLVDPNHNIIDDELVNGASKRDDVHTQGSHWAQSVLRIRVAP